MPQEVTDSDIVKSILRMRRMTQEDLAVKIKVGRSKLNMALSVGWLSDDIKKKILAGLELPAETFPDRKSEAPPVDDMVILMEKVDTILQQQKRILLLLEAK